jgi:putative transposase
MSRMNREIHVRICEGLGVKLPWSTRLCLTSKGERHYLWRAVDQDGNVLDILVQRRRNKRAAKKFFRKLLKGLTYVPRVIVTDKLQSYSAAKRETLPGV